MWAELRAERSPGGPVEEAWTCPAPRQQPGQGSPGRFWGEQERLLQTIHQACRTHGETEAQEKKVWPALPRKPPLQPLWLLLWYFPNSAQDFSPPGLLLFLFAERRTEALQLLEVKEISRDSDPGPPALRPSADTRNCIPGKAPSAARGESILSKSLLIINSCPIPELREQNLNSAVPKAAFS